MAREVENNSRRPKGTLPPVVVKSTPPAENDVSQDETTIAEDSTQSSLDDGDNLQKLVTALQELKQQARTDKLEEKQRTVELSRHLADELLTQRRMKNEQEARLDRDIKQVTETLKEALELERQSVKVEALPNEVAVVTEAKMTEHASAPDPKVQMAPIANLVTVQSQPSVRRPPASEAPARSQKFAPTPSTLANVPLSADKSTDSEISEEIEAEPSAASSIEEELPEEYTVPTDDAPDVNEVEEQIYDETFDSYAVDEELIRPHVDDEEREESPERSGMRI